MSNLLRFQLRGVVALASLVLALAVTNVKAQQSEEFDNYKLKIDAAWFYSNPTGTVKAQGDSEPIDFHRDLDFGSYSTFAGKIDWKFTHKNHFYVVIMPLWSSKTTTLSRDIVWDGNPIHVGSVVQSELHSVEVAPGYQYDIIRRRRGHLGVAVQIDLFNTTAKISAVAQANNQQAGASASASLLAPIPVAGPDFRFYFTKRISLAGNVMGMYLFGYGNFIS